MPDCEMIPQCQRTFDEISATLKEIKYESVKSCLVLARLEQAFKDNEDRLNKVENSQDVADKRIDSLFIGGILAIVLMGIGLFIK